MAELKRKNRKNKPHKLVPYRPEWAADFSKLKLWVSPLYGENLIDFQHIGSTSVPGMLANPIVDACAIVKNIDDVQKIRSKFVALGFEARGDYVGQGEEFFVFDENGKRKYNVHTLQADSPVVESYLSFRDYLRTQPDAAQEYIQIKKELRAEFGEQDYNSYDFNKGARIAHLKQEALKWYKKHRVAL